MKRKQDDYIYLIQTATVQSTIGAEWNYKEAQKAKTIRDKVQFWRQSSCFSEVIVRTLERMIKRHDLAIPESPGSDK